jgi:predicted DsbA family dithiol-disulfide isomerase
MAGASIVLFADFTCPFSYVTEAALRPLASGAGVAVDYRAFELYPAPAPLPLPRGDEVRMPALQALAAAAGVALSTPALLPRTRKAHEATRFARLHGREDDMRMALFRAYWRDGRDIGRIDVLMSLAGEAGLVPDDLKIALDIDAHADAVVRDRLVAERQGILHTPTMIVDAGGDPRPVVGAQEADDLRVLLRDIAAARGARGGEADEDAG